MPTWRWDPNVNRYRDASGSFMARREALRFVNESIEATANVADDLAALVGEGTISPADFRVVMRQEIKGEVIRQYLAGRGGLAQMTQADWGRTGGMIADQYRYLDGFVDEIAAGDLTEGQIRFRANMYIRSARESYERAHGVGRGIPFDEIPDWPGAGNTNCLCITDPTARVLTRDGWKPLKDVQVGEEVLTHRMRWRKVTGRVVKPSLPYHRQAYVRAPGGRWVGATHNHLWWTSDGWLDSTDICSYNDYVKLHYVKETEDHAGTILRELRSASVQSKQAGEMQGMSIDLPSLWWQKGHPLGAMRQMQRNVRPSLPARQRAMGRSGDTREDDGRSQRGPQESAAPLRGPQLGYELAGAGGWSTLHLLLGGWGERVDLPLPVGLPGGVRAHPARLRNTPQERRPNRRPPEQSGAHVPIGARSSARGGDDGDGSLQLGGARLPELRGDVPVAAEEEPAGEILLAEMLPCGTPLYDLTVEEDHSFVIEGLIAHNTNCHCAWDFEEVREGGEIVAWDCYWELSPGSASCETCIDNAGKWNPLRLPAV